jgi:hypothetical protein
LQGQNQMLPGHPISRRNFNACLLSAGVICSIPTALRAEGAHDEEASASSKFLHPGMLHSRADLIRMKEGVRDRTEPIFSGFNVLRNHPLSQSTYASVGASAEIGRNPSVRFPDFDHDANAAYQCALMSCITGDLTYAKVSTAIMDAWSAVLRMVSGADAVLCAGLGPFKMLNAAELMRHSNTGWPSESAERFGRMMRSAILPVIENFAPFANGNWDTAAMKMMMAIAIYDDDRLLFDRSLEYYRFGCGDGRLAHYIYPSGECQESGRDQQHTQLGLGHMGDCCEIAWHQGLDLYSSLDSRLLLGFEYTARYCLGEDVPFVPDIDQTGKYQHNVISARSNLRPVFEQIYNHYVHRRGIPAPWTQRAAEKLRPEGAGPGADQTGFGTLLYSRRDGPDTAEAAAVGAPASLHAIASDGAIELDFVPLARADHYTISRADNGSGAFVAIAQNVGEPTYRDHTVKAGHLYSYRVAALRSRRASLPATEMAGLPSGWQQSTIGLPETASCSFDGITYRLQAAGTSSLAQSISGLFVHSAMPTKSTFTARTLPLISSQFVELGVAVLTDGKTPEVEAVLSLSPRGQTERPAWSASLFRSEETGTPLQAIDSRPLTAPTVAYGRLVEPFWLRVERAGTALHAAISSDNKTWLNAGITEIDTGDKRVGLFLNSGRDKLTTEVCFDNVSLTPKS